MSSSTESKTGTGSSTSILGVTNGVQAAYSTMLRQGFGHIVNTASVAAFMPTPGLVSYGMSKHAVLGLSTSLRAESACTGIRVSVLCPGVIRTPVLEWGKYHEALEEMDADGRRRIIERLRPMDPAAFAEAALRAIAQNRLSSSSRPGGRQPGGSTAFLQSCPCIWRGKRSNDE